MTESPGLGGEINIEQAGMALYDYTVEEKVE
jgi:hypothetical protein